MKVIAINAHPDDFETGCCGTLLKHLAEGDEVRVVCVTRGGYDMRSWSIVENEMKEVEKITGLEYLVLEYRMGYYHVNRETVEQMTFLLSDVDVVYTHWFNDSHQDHRAVYQNVLAACRIKIVKSLRLYELIGYGRSETGFKPSLFVNITPYLDKKLKAVECYKSEVDFTPQFVESIRGLALFRGSVCFTKYAEAFEQAFEIVC